MYSVIYVVHAAWKILNINQGHGKICFFFHQKDKRTFLLPLNVISFIHLLQLSLIVLKQMCRNSKATYRGSNNSSVGLFICKKSHSWCNTKETSFFLQRCILHKMVLLYLPELTTHAQSAPCVGLPQRKWLPKEEVSMSRLYGAKGKKKC